MLVNKQLVLGAFVAVAFASPALAQTGHNQSMPMMKANSVMVVMPDGHMMSKTMTSAQMKAMNQTMRQNGKPATDTMIIMMMDGKMMMMPDMKMSDGTMVSDMLLKRNGG